MTGPIDEELAFHELGHFTAYMVNGASIAQVFPIDEDTAITQCIRINAEPGSQCRPELCPEDMGIGPTLAGPAFSVVYTGAPLEDVLRIGFPTVSLFGNRYKADITKVSEYIGPREADGYRERIEEVQTLFRMYAVLGYWLKHHDALRPLIDEVVATQKVTMDSASFGKALGDTYLQVMALGAQPELMGTAEARASVISALTDERQFPAPDFSEAQENITALRTMKPLQVFLAEMLSTEGMARA